MPGAGIARGTARYQQAVRESRAMHAGEVQMVIAPSSSSGSNDNVTTGSDEKPKGQFIERVDSDIHNTLQRNETAFENSGETGMLFRQDGQLTLIPAPTPDPRDPLNMSFGHKFLGMACLCLFGALAASAELILGAMLPVFVLQYAGVDPKLLLPLTEHGGFPQGTDPLTYLEDIPHAPPLVHVYLLASLPVLMMGIANLILIPAAIAVGRRPVVLFCGIMAIVGACWAGGSHSLASHLGARCVQALGAGTVESLIPFILQDTVFIHQRNFAISGVFACQGAIIIGLGIASPYMIIYWSWRWVYFGTAAGAGLFLIGVFLFMPETRYARTKKEFQGIPRPEHEFVDLQPRNLKYNLAIFHGEQEWRKGFDALMDSLRTFFYPHIFFITMLNSAMIATAFAAGYTVTPALLTKPWSWPFLHLGFCLFPVLIAAVFVAFVSGNMADMVANYFAKKRGRRLPENQLINLAIPTGAALLGTVLFGICGDSPDKYPWPLFLFALGLMAFGFLGANTVGAVYVLEAYPQLAG